ncbi:hypothetical protein L1987_51399 [Smallanthus sonchifolius]|uniref:Uncharacterized protein n=1 Tax=Smallanthus sonchifolius TaxID=185202 RepID=A0ACB9EPX0_9ASTR|nr:hypothetical protein L1987_51399 [Smallanthus sonchifolius]
MCVNLRIFNTCVHCPVILLLCLSINLCFQFEITADGLHDDNSKMMEEEIEKLRRNMETDTEQGDVIIFETEELSKLFSLAIAASASSPCAVTDNIFITVLTMTPVALRGQISSSVAFLDMLKLQPFQLQNPFTSTMLINSGSTMDIGTLDSLQYDFNIVKAATNNFSEENKLGRGGFGMVYKWLYVMYGHFSVKSDVFSYGMLLLEIVTGQKNQCFKNGESREHLLSFAWKSWRNGTTSDIIDPTLKTRSGSMHDIIRRYNSFTRSDGLGSSEYSVNEVSISDFVSR